MKVTTFVKTNKYHFSALSFVIASRVELMTSNTQYINAFAHRMNSDREKLEMIFVSRRALWKHSLRNHAAGLDHPNDSRI